MRVIGGTWRGRRLQAPSGRDVRPTTDRVREALFNILAAEIPGSEVVDLCCGAGGLGIEALSRGAVRAHFVDRARPALVATRANLAACGADPGCHVVIPGEAEAWLQRWAGPSADRWVLLCDPPYDTETAAAVMAAVTSGTLPAGLAAAVVEFGPATPDVPDADHAWEYRRYGASRLAIHRPGAAAPQEENTA